MSLQLCGNSVQCYLVLNYIFTPITKIYSILVAPYNIDFAGSPMLTNMDLDYIMLKDHAIRGCTHKKVL